MAEPIRVLQCFGRMDRGGAETLMMNVYRNIDRDKVQFDFVVHTTDKCAYDDEILALGGRIFRVPRYNGFNHLWYVSNWKNLFNSNKGNWQVIHGHMFTTASIYLRIAKINNINTIVHSHNTSFDKGLKGIFKRILLRGITKYADTLFACSQKAGFWLFGKNVCKKKKYYLINNAIDIKKYIFDELCRNKKRKELGIENKLVIGHIGRMDSNQKNHVFLLEIFSEICKINDESILLLIGDGCLREKFEKKTSNLQLKDKVKFLGVRSDIPDLLQSMDIFLFPSMYEGLPIVLIEAQASGLKCIISSTITKEVEITNLIEFIPLDKSAKYWANKALQQCFLKNRINTYSEIDKAHYGIASTVSFLQKYYLNEKYEAE